MSDIKTDERIKEAVRQTYGEIARRLAEEPALTCCCASSQPINCCGSPEEAVKTKNIATGLYSAEDLADLPDSVTGIALGCGNPTTIAELQAGEVVLDLGAGGGIDCFLAAKKVGPGGKVIGLDMTPEMVKLARRNAKTLGATNVEFRYGEMEDIPLLDESVDVIISNCVINLSPDKDAVFREAYRVLRPGGRMSVSDIVVYSELPQPIRDNPDAWADCLAGALHETDYLNKMRAARFTEVQVVSRDYTKISKGREWEKVRALLLEAGLSPYELDHVVASVRIKARKPG